MGNTELQSQHQTGKPILISHPEFQNAKIVKNSQSKQMIQIGISMKSEKDFLLWEKNYKRIPKINALLYPEEVRFQNKGCCGSSGVVMIQYQQYPYVLAEEITIRKNNNLRYFNESELWLLMYSLLSCAEIFHIRKLKIGDIRPQNIFMNQQGLIKVASQFSFPYGSTNYQKTLMNREIVTYLAPEQVKDLNLGKMKDSNQPSSAQPFSIGLTLLDAALLSSSQNFYQSNGTFSAQRLNQKLKALNTLNYSPQLINLITKLCEPIAANRMKANQVLSHLKPYENQILLKKAFNIKSLPLGQQNPQNSSNEISRISMNNKNGKNTKQGGYKYVNGVVFDQMQNSIEFSSLNQSKEVILKYSKHPITYEVKQGDKINQLTSPVRTTIHQPPIVISLPQPIQYNHNNPNQNF